MWERVSLTDPGWVGEDDLVLMCCFGWFTLCRLLLRRGTYTTPSSKDPSTVLHNSLEEIDTE